MTEIISEKVNIEPHACGNRSRVLRELMRPAAAKVRVLTLMVKQDYSDCTNANVPPEPSPSLVGGEAMVTLRDSGQTEVNVRLTNVAPNTTYHLFLKCHYLLGDIQTGANGRGNNTFFFPTKDSGAVFAFDMYPKGAPLGNKYQSIEVNFNAP
jgi:hypothetical protein